ncbi:MAG: class I SAM-dependent methyltransferase [Candidatus Binatia bacterium]|nr:class I SAM-dependent methyltransferase [Candidatus Binatia bacterium]
MDPTETDNQVDVALQRLRLLLAEHRRSPATAPTALGDGVSSESLLGLATAVSYARRLENVGQSAPAMAESGWIRRRVGQFAIRTLLSLLRTFTGEQRQFNRASVASFDEVRHALERHQREISSLRESRTGQPGGPTRRREEILDRSDLFRSLDWNKRFANITRDAEQRYTDYANGFVGLRNVLDVSCGTGRFLDACRRADVPSSGVDLDEGMVQTCMDRGLDVVRADSLRHLAELPDASLGGVFSAQFIEHLSSQDLVELLELIRDKVHPGGRVVLETLNPECLQVIYRWFWLDPTHRRLVHPWLLEELLRAAGFEEIEIHMIPPAAGAVRIPPLPAEPTSPQESGERNAEFDRSTNFLSDLLYSSTDYYVVATR